MGIASFIQLLILISEIWNSKTPGLNDDCLFSRDDFNVPPSVRMHAAIGTLLLKVILTLLVTLLLIWFNCYYDMDM